MAKMNIGIHRLSNKSCHRARVLLSSSLGQLMNYGSCFGRTALGLVLCVAPDARENQSATIPLPSDGAKKTSFDDR